MRARLIAPGLLAALAGALVTGFAPAQTPKAEQTGFTERYVRSADGVKLAWRFYKSPKSTTGAVVILIPAQGQGDIKNNVKWHGEALRLAANGFHVATFDHRGVGQSTEVVPTEFWLNRVNQNLVASRGNPATKVAIDAKKDFKTGYYPMLVQDIAAVRLALDQLNDTNEVNTSTVYLYGVGTGAELGLFFLGAEYFRERQKPNLPIPIQYVSPRRNLFVGSEPAGQDYGGAVWLGPARTTAINSQSLKRLMTSPQTIAIRTETPMLFVVGEKDTKGMTNARSLAQESLGSKLKPVGDAGSSPPRGGRLPYADVSLATIKKADAAAATGLNLLGINSGAEDAILKFLKEAEAQRKGRPRQTRLWDRPLIIDVEGFGV